MIYYIQLSSFISLLIPITTFFTGILREACSVAIIADCNKPFHRLIVMHLRGNLLHKVRNRYTALRQSLLCFF